MRPLGGQCVCLLSLRVKVKQVVCWDSGECSDDSVFLVTRTESTGV